MLKNRKELGNILKLEISDKEKREEIANINNYNGRLFRILSTNFPIELEVGQIWDNKGSAESFSQPNNGFGFEIENLREHNYMLEVENGTGYELQYFTEDYLVDELMENENIDWDTAYDKALEIIEDETYSGIMDLLGSEGAMFNEAEVLVSKDTKLEIISIEEPNDEWDYTYVRLKMI